MPINRREIKARAEAGDEKAKKQLEKIRRNERLSKRKKRQRLKSQAQAGNSTAIKELQAQKEADRGYRKTYRKKISQKAKAGDPHAQEIIRRGKIRNAYNLVKKISDYDKLSQVEVAIAKRQAQLKKEK